jgi:hypothetical protein
VALELKHDFPLVINGRRTAENVTRNLGAYVETPSIHVLKDQYRGKPAIIVSAGPSLRKNKHHLRDASGKAVIIAVQTILQPLLEMGIEPQFVTSLDYHDISTRYYEKLPKDIMELVGTVWCGPKNHCVVYWLRRGELLNFVGCPEDPSWDEESWNQRRPWQELKGAYAGWHPKIQAIIDAAERDQCYRWSLFDRKPIHNWSSERATLLGDAAHPTLPFIAQGACMAIEDGAVLARALDESSSVPEALELYQRARVERCARVVLESAEHGTLYHMKDAAQMKKAFADRNIAKERAQWLYNYDPLRVPLQDEDLPL